MKNTRVDIPYLFVVGLTSVADKIVGFTLKHHADAVPINNVHNVWIQSKGVFQSVMCFRIDESLEKAVLDGMQVGQDSSSEIRELYLAEFINILSGHAMTLINNAVGRTSRLSVPQVRERQIKENTGYEHMCEVYFTSKYGNMELQINYELLA